MKNNTIMIWLFILEGIMWLKFMHNLIHYYWYFIYSVCLVFLFYKAYIDYVTIHRNHVYCIVIIIIFRLCITQIRRTYTTTKQIKMMKIYKNTRNTSSRNIISFKTSSDILSKGEGWPKQWYWMLVIWCLTISQWLLNK